MSILDTLISVEAVRPSGYDPIRGRRRKLAGAIDNQLARITAELAGTTFKKVVTKRYRDLETDILTEREEQRRVAPWWWQAEDGSILLQIRYGSAVIPLAQGKTVFTVPDLSAAHAALQGVKKAALSGQLDGLLVEAAVALRARFSARKKTKG